MGMFNHWIEDDPPVDHSRYRTVTLTNIKYSEETAKKLEAIREERTAKAEQAKQEHVNALISKLAELVKKLDMEIQERESAGGLVAFALEKDEKTIERLEEEVEDLKAEIDSAKNEPLDVDLGDTYLQTTTTVVLRDVDPNDIDLLDHYDEIQKKAEDWIGWPIESFNYKSKYTETRPAYKVTEYDKNGHVVADSARSDEDDPIIDQVNYSGMSFSIWKDKTMYYTIIAGKRADICELGVDYRDRIKLVVDSNLNLIQDFGGGAKLVYFQNGKHRDMKLIDGDRTLKIFLTTGTGEVDEDKLIASAKTSLNKYRKAELK